MEPNLGLGHFLAHADGVGRFLLAVLLAMSLASWCLIIGRTLWSWRLAHRRRRFVAALDAATDLDQVEQFVLCHDSDEPFSRLARHGLIAMRQYRAGSDQRMLPSVSAEAFLDRALQRTIQQETTRLEYGQTVLASVAAAAPFVGLFGTVWGIYHALLAIGMSGQASLDKVAGPVGEALIMTALGLAVAIPAVLAYNSIARSNRLLLAALDGFAHDLFAFMSTGRRLPVAQTKPARTRAHAAAEAA